MNDLLRNVLGIGQNFGDFLNKKKQDLMNIFSPKIYSPLPAPKLNAYKPAPPVRIAPPVINKPKNNFLVDFFKTVSHPIQTTQQGIQNWAQRNPQSAYRIINAPQQIQQNVSNFVRNPVRPIIRQAGGLYTGLTNPMRQTLTKNFGEQLGGTLATLPPSVTFGAPQLAGKIPKVVNFLSKVGKEIPF